MPICIRAKEKFKGDVRTYTVVKLGSDWCGYGFNHQEPIWQWLLGKRAVEKKNDSTSTYSLTEDILVALAKSQNIPHGRYLYPPGKVPLGSLEILKTKPFFRANPKELFDTDEGNAKQFAKNSRAELLAKGLSARTLPAGANAFTENIETGGLIDIESVDMHSSFKTNEGKWPRQGVYNLTNKENSWLHSDFKNIAYPHNYKLYDFIIEKGNLK